MKTGEFFYCYSTNLHDFLRRQGQRYICAGLHETTHRKFYLYYRTDELNGLLTEYGAGKPAV